MIDLPTHLVPLLEAPNFGFLGTIRPDDTVQVNPMWFAFDGEHLLFTHTTKRAKFRNLQHNPSMSLAVTDGTNGYLYLEVRGKLVEVRPDPDAEFFLSLARRYGNTEMGTPDDAPDRVVLVMSIEHHTTQ